MATIDLNLDNFSQTVAENEIVLVEFWASWCGPCKTFSPIFEQVSDVFSTIVFGRVDTEHNAKLAACYQVYSIPTVMIFREEILVFMESGALPSKVLVDLINRVKGLDMDDIRRHANEHSTQGVAS